jgi:hypothetical protein
VEADAVKAVVTGRFGDKAVISDPTDPEANNRAMAQGYTVVAGGSMSREAWGNVRSAGALLPAGQVTPSPNPNEGRDSAKRMKPEHYPEAVANIVAFSKALGERILADDTGNPVSIEVHVVNDPQWPFLATYGKRGRNDGELTFNLGRLGFRWFDDGPTVKVIDLCIHEFGHHFAPAGERDNHLTERYYDALTRLGARAVRLALDEPSMFTAHERGAVAA